jgi:hypothetical protein
VCLDVRNISDGKGNYMDEDTRNSNDIALELARLHILRGIEFTRQLRQITQRKEFRLVKDETEIFSAIGEYDDDFPALLNAAQKAVSHGYRVYILPNPKGIRTADFIFERKGVYRMYDLKTIQGKTSILNRLVESIGQTNHVLLNMATDYNARLLALQIQKYFEWNPDAGQILIFKGNKMLVVTRRTLEASNFIATFTRLYNK